VVLSVSGLSILDCTFKSLSLLFMIMGVIHNNNSVIS
jgi:hypothetical protein